MNDDESNGRMSPASQRYHARHGLTEHQRFEPCCVSDSSPRLNITVLVSPSPPTAIPRQLRRLPMQEDGDPNFQEEARNEDEDYHKRQRHQRRSRTPSPSSLGYRNSDESNRKKRRRLHFHESSACLNEKDESEDCQPVTIRQKKGSTQSRGRHAELVSHKTSALDLDDTSYGPLPRPDTYQVREGHPLVNPTTERHPLKKVTCSIEQLDDAERQDTMNLNVSLDKFCGQLDAPITESYNRPRAFFHFQQSAQSPKNINGLPPPEFHHDKLTRDKYLALRVRQRRLYADVEGDCRSPDEPTLHFLSHKQYRNNHYFHHAVVRAREGFLDAQNLYVIADKTANFVAKMQARNRFDEDRFVNSLWGKCVQQTFKKGRCFDWGFLGREASICFNAVPSNVRFLSGDIDAPKEAKSRQARSRTVVPEDKILVVNVETASERTHLSKRQGEHPHKEILSTMKRRLKERCAEMYNANRIKAESINDSHALAKAKLHGSEIDGIQFLINPNSFTQSVENIFNFSYLVKQGQSEIGVRPCGGDFEIQGLYVKKRHGKVVADLPCRQAVCKFSMRDWRWLCQTYGHKKGDLPHRCSPFTRAP